MIGPPRPRIDQHVGRLDVPVDQPRRVRGVQRRRHGRDDGRGPGRRQRALAAQQAADVAAGHVAHRDEQHAACLARLVDGDDVRVIDRGRGPRLAEEPAPELLVGRQRRGQDLQRHRPVKPLVEGAEDDGHPARADLFLKAVPGDPRSRQGQPPRHRRAILRPPSLQRSRPARPVPPPRVSGTGRAPPLPPDPSKYPVRPGPVASRPERQRVPAGTKNGPASFQTPGPLPAGADRQPGLGSGISDQHGTATMGPTRRDGAAARCTGRMETVASSIGNKFENINTACVLFPDVVRTIT